MIMSYTEKLKTTTRSHEKKSFIFASIIKRKKNKMEGKCRIVLLLCFKFIIFYFDSMQMK